MQKQLSQSRLRNIFTTQLSTDRENQETQFEDHNKKRGSAFELAKKNEQLNKQYLQSLVEVQQALLSSQTYATNLKIANQNIEQLEYQNEVLKQKLEEYEEKERKIESQQQQQFQQNLIDCAQKANQYQNLNKRIIDLEEQYKLQQGLFNDLKMQNIVLSEELEKQNNIINEQEEFINKKNEELEFQINKYQNLHKLYQEDRKRVDDFFFETEKSLLKEKQEKKKLYDKLQQLILENKTLKEDKENVRKVLMSSQGDGNSLKKEIIILRQQFNETNSEKQKMKEEFQQLSLNYKDQITSLQQLVDEQKYIISQLRSQEYMNKQDLKNQQDLVKVISEKDNVIDNLRKVLLQNEESEKKYKFTSSQNKYSRDQGRSQSRDYSQSRVKTNIDMNLFENFKTNQDLIDITFDSLEDEELEKQSPKLLKADSFLASQNSQYSQSERCTTESGFKQSYKLNARQTYLSQYDEDIMKKLHQSFTERNKNILKAHLN